VRDGHFEDNRIENNGKYGISIGHKDTGQCLCEQPYRRQCLFRRLFRKETFKNSGHRNRFSGNKVLNNGNAKEGYGFYIEPLRRPGDFQEPDYRHRVRKERTQRYGVYKAAGVRKSES